MYKLLNAGFSRLIKNKIFWGIVVITVIIALGLVFNRISSSGFFENELEPVLTNYIYFIGFFIAIFTSLFVGTEYSDGAIRNKIVVGHTRKNIYLSNLIISISVGLFIEFVYLILVMIIGLPTLGGLKIPIDRFLFILLDMIFIVIAYSSIFNFITLMCSDITIATVICIIAFIGMFVVSEFVVSPIANDKKYYSNYVTNENGEVIETQKRLNPNYVGDFAKQVYKNILYIIPSGQAFQIQSTISNLSFENDRYMTDKDIKLAWIYSLGLIIVINGIGMYFFNRKDLK